MKKRLGIIMVLAAAMALLAGIACGSAATAPVPTQPPPTETPVKGNPPPEEPKTVVAPAPIEDTTVVAPAEASGEYVLKIISGLPNGCATFNGYQIERDFNRFVVRVTNLMPAPSEPIACTEIYRTHEGEVVLGSGLVAGPYSIDINDELTHVFTPLHSDDQTMVEKESPIEKIKVEKIEMAGVDLGYLLTVTSRLPKGSSCSRVNGYKINRRFAEHIVVTVTHMEVAEDNVPCTADLPVVTMDVLLGKNFAENQTYTVSVNGTEYTFPEALATTGADSGSSGSSGSNEDGSRGPGGPGAYDMPVGLAPIEGSTVVPPETAGGPYVLKITSGLPSGCAQFYAYQLTMQGNDYSVEVFNRMPADGNIACTMIYGYHEGQLTLGDGALNPGETYTVTINGELAHTFTAK